VPTVLLIRHGQTTANRDGILVGRAARIGLDQFGVRQASALASRLAGVRLVAVVSGPLRRCRQTAGALMAVDGRPEITIDYRLTECDYGEWSGRSVRDLARDRLWRTVQTHPSAVTFPGGESMRAVQARAVDAVREHDATVSRAAGSRAVWAVVSHGDVIKTVVADALGMHLDLFQRLIITPASVTVVRYTDRRPFVVKLNDTDGELSWLRSAGTASGDGEVGGGSGWS
jgi:probable phosphomutase (TIGR03848 family)